MGMDGNGRALLNEVVKLLQKLLATGEGGSIDLARMSLSDADHDLIDEVLGEGEVSAEVTARGIAEVVASGVPGVWWITHYNAEDEVMAQFIEVAFCPEILQAWENDVKEGLESLQACLFEEHLNG